MRRRLSMVPGSTHPPQQKQAHERRADGVDLDCFLPGPIARQTDQIPDAGVSKEYSEESSEGEMGPTILGHSPPSEN
jgi:hypothetical protein